MSEYHPRLLQATNPRARIDALCEFIEFWLGERRPSYGETAEALDRHSLPAPLRQFYEFAGRWPNQHQAAIEYDIPAFSYQDSLMTLQGLTYEDDGKLVFLHENQGHWHCRTLSEGDDPPVWFYGEHSDEHENGFAGTKLVSNSLSEFLVTFALQELSLGSCCLVEDSHLNELFSLDKNSAIPIWTNGHYVNEIVYDYYLWKRILVTNCWGQLAFAANDAASIRFLKES